MKFLLEDEDDLESSREVAKIVMSNIKEVLQKLNHDLTKRCNQEQRSTILAAMIKEEEEMKLIDKVFGIHNHNIILE